MDGEHVINLIQRLERVYPKATHPEIAASISRMRRAYAKDLQIKQLCELAGVKLPRGYATTAPLFQRMGAQPK